MAILPWILIAVLAVAVATLVTPVRMHGHLQTAPRLSYSVDLRLLGGYAPKFRVIDSSRPPNANRRAKAITKTAKGKQGRWSPKAPALLSAVPDLLARFLGAFEVEQLEIDVTFGLGDPADTGTCLGVLMPLQYGIGPVRRSISIQPDFSQASFTGKLNTVFHVAPIKLLIPVARFAWAVFGSRT